MASQLVLALLTGFLAGTLFSLVQIPIPAPANLSGVLGIVGIFLGYKGVEWLGIRVDLLEVLSSVF
ncbi:XapX domain-containing protein [Halorussus sp. AFM4]|uniref:XapX domain-containing protein n=1 Tax=Halorussus sp. AFM4 TaxID=3421651 RepID=UPI003EC0CC0B